MGGSGKGFHAVALRGKELLGIRKSLEGATIADWCLAINARIVGVDAPCGWSQTGSSRVAERDLRLFGEKLHCFSTPSKARAMNSASNFYGWVLNGELLYARLMKRYRLFDGERIEGPVCLETFPQAVACELAGRVVSAKSKVRVRRQVLKSYGLDESVFPNIDFVDAALCAVVADHFFQGKYQKFGVPDEGFIVVPKISVGA